MKKQLILVPVILMAFAAGSFCPAAEESLSRCVLDNGLTVIIKEDHVNPVVSVTAVVDAGLSSEGAYTGTGISHFIEHTLFKGTAKRKSGDIEEEVKSFGGTVNAWTGLDSTTYAVTVPAERAGDAIALMEDVLFHPAFRADEVEKEKQVILKEIRLTNDDPTRRVMRGLWKTSYLEHPYKMPIIGYEELFEGLDRNDLVRHHSLRYVPSNVILAIVGDIETHEVLPRIKKVFGKNKRKRTPVDLEPAEPPQNSSRRSKTRAPINLGYLAMGYHTVSLSSRDVYALDVLAIILGDWDGSRLTRKLVKDERLLYTASAFNYAPRYPGLFIVYGVGDQKKLETAEKEILGEIRKISERGVERSELAAAKNMVMSGYMDSLETTGGLAGAISRGEFLTGDASFFEKYVENVKKVSGDDVRRAAKKYLTENNLTLSYLLPQAATETDAHTPTDESARTELSSGSIPSRQDLPARMADGSSPERVVLPNGIRLILKRNPRIPKISVICAFPGGLMGETKKNNGISNLTSALLLKGTKKRREDQIKPFLQSRGGNISHFSGNNTFGISMEFLSADTEASLEVLSDILANSVFPEAEIEKEKEKIYAAIKAENDDVYNTGFLKLREAVFGNYPYGMRALGETGSVKNITRKDIQNFYRRFAAAGGMVISVVGDFRIPEMKNSVERFLSVLREGEPPVKIPKPAILNSVNKMVHSMTREQSLMLIGFRGATFEGNDKYCLSILSSVLSGENGRLYRTIRNELGLSYALGVFSSPGIDTGIFAAYLATDKEHLEKAKNILFDELEKTAEGDISDEEIQFAKNSLIGRQTISLQSNVALAYKMALDEIYGMGYDAYRAYPRKISDISKEDVLEAAGRYIDLRRFGLVTIRGEEKGALQ